MSKITNFLSGGGGNGGSRKRSDSNTSTKESRSSDEETDKLIDKNKRERKVSASSTSSPALPRSPSKDKLKEAVTASSSLLSKKKSGNSSDLLNKPVLGKRLLEVEVDYNEKLSILNVRVNRQEKYITLLEREVENYKERLLYVEACMTELERRGLLCSEGGSEPAAALSDGTNNKGCLTDMFSF